MLATFQCLLQFLNGILCRFVGNEAFVINGAFVGYSALELLPGLNFKNWVLLQCITRVAFFLTSLEVVMTYDQLYKRLFFHLAVMTICRWFCWSSFILHELRKESHLLWKVTWFSGTASARYLFSDTNPKVFTHRDCSYNAFRDWYLWKVSTINGRSFANQYSNYSLVICQPVF